jgi:two-component system, NtrC family, nitrogen regulation sensor histidine kinase GlnL
MTNLFTRGDFRTDRYDLSGVLAHAAEPGVITIDSTRRIVSLNATAERLTRLSTEAVTGSSVAVLPEALREAVEEGLRANAGVQDRSLVLPTEGNGKAIVCLNTLLVRDAAGRPMAVLLILHDLSAAREFEVKTERLQRLAQLGILSAGVAHEIKNALVAIKSFAEWLLEKNSSEADMVSLVVQEVNRINSLVGQLLKLAGPAKPIFSEVQAHECIENALRLIKHQLKNRNIQLVVALEAGSDTLRGDAKQLEQAFINLLLNAVEAMGETGQLTVSSEVIFATEVVSKFEPKIHQQQLQITFRDTGSGIPAQVLEQLYSPFRTTKPGGTGLGLTITRRIVIAHGGRIAVETEVGQGTAFKITLPLARSAMTNGKASSHPASPESL